MPLVAVVGIASKMVIYDVRSNQVVKSVRVLISNWSHFKGLTLLGQNELAVGCLDGSLKVYKSE
jgi:hypothetical protein